MKSYKFILYLCPLVIILLSSCMDDFFVNREWVEEGIPTQISLSFKAEDRPVVSRAAADATTESNVYNLHLFIFDDQGRAIFNKFYREGELDHHTDDMTSGTLLIRTTSTNNARIIGIANINTDNVSTDYELEDDLTAITTLEELKSVVAKMKSQTVNRTNAFFMSGYAEKKYPTEDEDKTSIIIPGDGNTEVDAILKLKRMDAKITFNVTALKPDDKNWTDFSFQPYEWRICKTPQQSLLVEDKDKDYDDASAVYYDSKFLPFETINRDDETALYYGGSFTFYMPENRKVCREEITDNNYALREKRDIGENVSDPNKPGQTYKPGEFTYANENSTYVEMTGMLSYRDEFNYLVSASVRFYIHLGYVNGVNDYETKRNVSYTYNVKVRGVDNIETEVTQYTPGDDPRPGYEGEVVFSSDNTYFLDAHYDRALLHIRKNEIVNMTWGVVTPYSTGVYSGSGDVPESLIDYKWIKFAINKDYGTESNIYVKYPGDQNYKGGDDKPSGYSQHPSDARLLDVNQLVQRLKEEVANPDSEIFEEDETVSITAFIDEYVYVNTPGQDSQTENLLMWKQFVEANDRQMHLTNGEVLYSPDGNSSIVHSKYTFRQKSIRTVYDKDKQGLEKVWGLESVMEAVGNPNEPGNGGGVRLKTGDVSEGNSLTNGRQNSIDMLVGEQWTKVINVEEGGASLNSDYQTAVYACLTRNRDLNGNNIVEANEIRWYLAAINQLTDIYIGQNALDVDAHLFPENSASRPEGNKLFWHYTSSSKESDGNPWILWSEECGGRSNLGASNSQDKNGIYYAYRCVRNLGISLNDVSTEPTPLISYTKQSDGTYLVDATNLSPKARRGYVSGVLPSHDELSRSNLLYDRFIVNNRDSDIPEPKITINYKNKWWWENHIPWSECISKEQEMKDFRLPNQRELLVMLNVLPKDAWKVYSDSWFAYKIDQKAMYMCKTSFSKAGQEQFGSKRETFRMNAQGNSIGVVNDSGTDKGYIRGVKDYKSN